jgi:uncharacterized damage-inducible protein DinB
MNLADIKHLFAYTEWANNLVLDAVEQLTEEQLRRDSQTSHGSIFGTLLHNAGAEWIWLERWQGRSPVGPDAWTLWREDSCSDLATLRQRWRQVIANRHAFLASLDEAQLAANRDFRLISGDADSLPLAGLMQHVVNHSTLHRGQIVGMLRQMGVKPPATDLLFYLREKAAEARA